jgi:hypothetical protein
MLIDRLKPYMSKDELYRIVSEARSSQRRINVRTVSPLCLALERAAIDGNIPSSAEKVPRKILQFWDQKTIPADVQDCMATWRAIPGFNHVIFDEDQARDFLRTEYDARHVEAYDLCSHPTMKSDLFRLACLYRHGGVYIDADDVFGGSGIDRLFRDDGFFKLRSASFKNIASQPAITIFNNNPIFCVAKDKILRNALERATTILLGLGKRDVYNILVITGPVNLSIALYATALDCIADGVEFRFCPILGWDDVARKNSNLEYQKTGRNWRRAQ